MTAVAPSLNAQRTAVSRAIHQLLDNPRVFDDPLAVAIAGEEMRYHRALAAARSRYAEDELNAAIARGATQYVILGSGLDTYAYRNQNTNLRVFEVDQAAVQNWKRTRLDKARIGIPPWVTFVATAFEEGSLPSALEYAGFQASEVSFFSWLGVSPFPNAQAALAALAFIGSLPGGSGMALDYAICRSLLYPVEETAMDALASRSSIHGESLQLLIDSGALDRLLRSAGFHEIEDLGPEEIDQRYFNDRADGLGVPPGLIRFVSARV